MIDWDKYCAICKKNKIENPYENQAHFNKAYGISTEEVISPMQVRPKQDRRTIDAIFSNYVKVESDSR